MAQSVRPGELIITTLLNDTLASTLPIQSFFSVKIMFRTLLFVTFIAWARAGDGGFYHFCKTFIEGTMEVEQRGTDKVTTCEKTFKLVDVPAASAEAICQYRGRFAVDTTSVDNNQLICKWMITVKHVRNWPLHPRALL